MKFHLLILIPILFTLSLAGCGGKSETIMVEIGNQVFTLEVARTAEERARGLMERKNLPQDRGMIFVFPEDGKLSFWMKNTPLPLSIAFLSREGVIKEIYDLEPYSLKPVESLYYARYALELNRGAFERAGVSPGYRIILPEGFLSNPYLP